MKTMYKVHYTTGGYDWTDVDNYEMDFVPTLEEAMEMGKTIKHEGGWGNTGDWNITKHTMDEETFTYKVEVVYYYDWYEEVGQFEHYAEMVEYHTKELEKARAMKPKTENGEQRKQKKIAEELKVIEEYKKELEKKGL